MADEASVLIVARMRDEASAGMKTLGTTTQRTQADTMQFRMALMATGSALSSVGSLLNQLESPQAKVAGRFFMISGALINTTSAIMNAIPMIQKLTASLRSLAIMQTITHALSGPAGWALLGGAVVGGGILAAGALRGSQPAGGNVTIVNNIGGSVITEREVGEITRREIIKAQSRSGTSGIK